MKFKHGDKVLFSLANKGEPQLKTNVGIVLSVGERYSILRITPYIKSVYHNIEEDLMAKISDNELVISEIENHFNNEIKIEENKLKYVTDEIKEDERFKKYEKLKTQIKKTAKNLYNSKNNYEFENKLKAICSLKKQLYTIELGCVSDIRKYNGSVLYEIKELNRLKNRFISEVSDEYISNAFKNF